jgi:uncharacterized membrane protein (UPF0127 family)
MNAKIKRFMIISVMTVSFIFAGVEAYQQFEIEIAESPEYESGLRVEEVTIQTEAGGNPSFQVEVAEKPIDIQVGLMHRKSMPEEHGMLFLLSEEPKAASFWMKNTLIPLDMLFIGRDGKILNLHHNAQPHALNGIKSGVPVVAVIEINGGLAKKLGIKIGDRVIHPYFH